MIGWKNGTLDEVENLTVSVRDRGFQFGEGLYETMLVHHRDVPLVNRHLRRLRSSCERLDLPYPGDEQVQRAITETVDENTGRHGGESPQKSFVLKLLLTGGIGQGLYRSNPPEPELLVLPRSLPPRIKQWKKNGGIGQLVEATGSTGNPLAQVKSTSRLGETLALERTRHEDEAFREALFIDEDHQLLQGARTNIFLKLDDAWITPPVYAGLLPGVARELFLDGAASNRVSEANLFSRALFDAESVVVTNAVTGPIQLRKIQAPSLFAFEEKSIQFRVKEQTELDMIWQDCVRS